MFIPSWAGRAVSGRWLIYTDFLVEFLQKKERISESITLKLEQNAEREQDICPLPRRGLKSIFFLILLLKSHSS